MLITRLGSSIGLFICRFKSSESHIATRETLPQKVDADGEISPNSNLRLLQTSQVFDTVSMRLIDYIHRYFLKGFLGILNCKIPKFARNA